MIRCFTLLLFVAVSACGGGLNLPPTQGTSNAGAFLPGVYRFDYEPDLLLQVKEQGFTHIRVPVNVATATNAAAMKKVAALFACTDFQGIVCMFDTNEAGETGHGNGKPNDIEAIAAAWRRIHSGFKGKSGLMYELFNEPFGYPKDKAGQAAYMADMRTIIKKSGLPEKRCIIDGMGYSDNVRMVADAGWEGAVGYHFYPNWLPEGRRTRERFSRLVQNEIGCVSNVVYITEFGANLGLGDVYETDADANRNTAALAGLHDALLALKQRVKTYHWHGWDNDDRYSFWGDKNQFGAQKIRAIGAARPQRD